jgi:hypothetical protein
MSKDLHCAMTESWGKHLMGYLLHALGQVPGLDRLLEGSGGVCRSSLCQVAAAGRSPLLAGS